MAYYPEPQTFTHKKYSQARLDEIYNEASCWQDLAFIPYLLFRYQYKHHKDSKVVKEIAAYCSCKLGKHKWCFNDIHCYFQPKPIPVVKPLLEDANIQ